MKKCCKTHVFLQKSEPMQPKTSNILPKFCRSLRRRTGLASGEALEERGPRRGHGPLLRGPQARGPAAVPRVHRRLRDEARAERGTNVRQGLKTLKRRFEAARPFSAASKLISAPKLPFFTSLNHSISFFEIFEMSK